MARLTFNTPFMLGFENLERMMDQVTKTGAEGGFPPYNIEQMDSDTLRISLAVAGYDEKDLDVSVEDTQLIIRGRQSSDQEEHHYLYRGIAGRNFQRSFVLAQGMKVKSAFFGGGYGISFSSRHELTGREFFASSLTTGGGRIFSMFMTAAFKSLSDEVEPDSFSSAMIFCLRTSSSIDFFIIAHHTLRQLFQTPPRHQLPAA